MSRLCRVAVCGLALATAPIAGSCTNVAEERARDDLEIGHAHGGALDVDVEGGLACVRGIAAGELSLRAQAPLLKMTVRVNDSAPRLKLVLDNAMVDATLDARDRSGRPLTIETLDGARITQKVWSVEVPADRELVLVTHTQDEAERATPFRFAVLADVQEAIDRVGDVYAKINEDPSIRFIVFSGDLTQRGTEDQLREFERREHELRVPLFATLGNHELGSDRVWFQTLFGRGSFHFSFRGVEFSMLDSASAAIDPLVYGWLDDWLAASRDRVHVVGMHIPPLDPIGTRNGAFASRSEASKLLAKLAQGRVDLSLYGHIHSFYAYENAGIPAYISGGGGAIPERFDGIGRNFLVVDVLPDDGPRVGNILNVGLVRIDDGP